METTRLQYYLQNVAKSDKIEKKQRFCKIDLTKLKFFTFFLITIRYISQKCYIFAAILKNATKLLKIFNIYKRMKNYNEKMIIFRPIQGVWQDVAGESGTLADTLKRFEIIVDDKLQYGRFYQYEKNTVTEIRYRVENTEKITITIWKTFLK